VDAAESIAADLGRGLSQARLYEAENHLVEDLKALDKSKSARQLVLLQLPVSVYGRTRGAGRRTPSTGVGAL
jgi:hypothetical protein